MRSPESSRFGPKQHLPIFLRPIGELLFGDKVYRAKISGKPRKRTGALRHRQKEPVREENDPNKDPPKVGAVKDGALDFP